MPAAVMVPALLSAATTGAGMAMDEKRDKRAGGRESAARAEAMAFEREKEARRKQEFDTQMDDYRERYREWENRRNTVLARMGVIPSMRPNTEGRPGGGMDLGGGGGGGMGMPLTLGTMATGRRRQLEDEDEEMPGLDF